MPKPANVSALWYGSLQDELPVTTFYQDSGRDCLCFPVDSLTCPHEANHLSSKFSAFRVPLLLVAEEVSLETEKEVLAHGVDAVFPKQDDPTALALHVRALYGLMGNRGEGQS